MSRSKSTAKAPKKGTAKTSARMLANRSAKDAPLTGTSSPGIGISLGQRVARANRYRDGLNPLRGLTLGGAVTMIEQYSRGEFANLMWTFGAPFMGIECADPDLLALISRRTSAINRLNWKIKIVDKEQEDFDEGLATKQAKALREIYNGIQNLRKAIRHLVLASFRGFSHLEKIVNSDGDLTELRIVQQWNVVRDGMCGEWKYNPDAIATNFNALPTEYVIDPEWFIIREVDLPINRFALTKFIRANLSEKDWDAYIEIFGIPGGVVEMPPNVPADKEPEYLSAAQEIAKGGSGAIPNGSKYYANDSARGNQPYRPRLDYLAEKLVLAGTGGMLTMLAQSGSGTLAGSAHQEAFDSIAQQEGAEITESFQEQIDRPALERLFPGQPVLAYFCIDSDYKDTGKILDYAVKAHAAGFMMDAEELSEDSGYTLTLAPTPVGAEAGGGRQEADGRPYANRTGHVNRILNAAGLQPLNPKFVKAARRMAALGTAKDLKQILDRLETALSLPDEKIVAALKQLQADAPKLLKAINAKPALADALNDILGTALAEGLTQKPPMAAAKK